MPSAEFMQRTSCELDGIFMSPHYGYIAEYAASLDNVLERAATAPYIWEPYFVSQRHQLERGWAYQPREGNEPMNIVLMEPNISFQKCSLVPLLIAETLYRRRSDLIRQISVVNGDRLFANVHFRTSILPRLKLFNDGLINFLPRMTVIDSAKVHPKSVLIMHQIGNEYNYMLMDHMWMGVPVLHNAPSLKNHAYYYPESNLEAGADMLENIILNHDSRHEAYMTSYKQLEWRFSPHNPDNIEGWKRVMATPQLEKPFVIPPMLTKLPEPKPEEN
jgi:hypothetical protein